MAGREGGQALTDVGDELSQGFAERADRRELRKQEMI